jgi:hypothetical protein
VEKEEEEEEGEAAPGDAAREASKRWGSALEP